MSLLDLAIIYLACGAPFGVHQLSVSERSDWRVLRTTSTILLWPLFAVRHLFRLADPDALRADELGEIRIAIEEAAFSRRSAGDLFEFREIFGRYTGLAGTDRSGRPAVTSLLQAVGHPRPDIAARCLDRRNSQRIDLHREMAKQELIAVLSDVSEGPAREIISQQLASLTLLLNADQLHLEPRQTHTSVDRIDIRSDRSESAAAVSGVGR